MASSIDQVMKAHSLHKSCRPSALHTDGSVIYSYALPLFYRRTGQANRGSMGVSYWFLSEKPSISVTTSKHYNQVKRALLDAGLVPVKNDRDGSPVLESQYARDCFGRRGFDYQYQQYRLIGE